MSNYKFKCDKCGINRYSDDMTGKDWKGRICCKFCYTPKPLYLEKQPVIHEILAPHIIRPDTSHQQAVPEQDGISVWDQVYYTIANGYVTDPDFTWDQWDSNWDD